MARRIGSHWNQTETCEALKVCIQFNIDSLKDAVVGMLGGEEGQTEETPPARWMTRAGAAGVSRVGRVYKTGTQGCWCLAD